MVDIERKNYRTDWEVERCHLSVGTNFAIIALYTCIAKTLGVRLANIVNLLGGIFRTKRGGGNMGVDDYHVSTEVLDKLEAQLASPDYKLKRVEEVGLGGKHEN